MSCPFANNNSGVTPDCLLDRINNQLKNTNLYNPQVNTVNNTNLNSSDPPPSSSNLFCYLGYCSIPGSCAYSVCRNCPGCSGLTAAAGPGIEGIPPVATTYPSAFKGDPPRYCQGATCSLLGSCYNSQCQGCPQCRNGGGINPNPESVCPVVCNAPGSCYNPLCRGCPQCRGIGARVDPPSGSTGCAHYSNLPCVSPYLFGALVSVSAASQRLQKATEGDERKEVLYNLYSAREYLSYAKSYLSNGGYSDLSKEIQQSITTLDSIINKAEVINPHQLYVIQMEEIVPLQNTLDNLYKQLDNMQ